MKATIYAVVVTALIGGIVLYKPNTSEYVRESSEEEITAVPEVVEVDVVDSAKAELERINQELDAEEASVDAEIAAIKAEADEKIATLQARKERIKETRQGF